MGRLDVDDIIKIFLAASAVLIILLCILAIMFLDVNAQEVSLLNGVLNLISGAYIAIIGYYWGTAVSKKRNN